MARNDQVSHRSEDCNSFAKLLQCVYHILIMSLPKNPATHLPWLHNVLTWYSQGIYQRLVPRWQCSHTSSRALIVGEKLKVICQSFAICLPGSQNDSARRKMRLPNPSRTWFQSWSGICIWWSKVLSTEHCAV